MTRMCMHFIIEGKVQGVCFRASTKSMAEQLNVTGWIRNLPNGGVEVLACGDHESIKKLTNWLHRGPDFAQVKSVLQEERTWQEHLDFVVK